VVAVALTAEVTTSVPREEDLRLRSATTSRSTRRILTSITTKATARPVSRSHLRTVGRVPTATRSASTAATCDRAKERHPLSTAAAAPAPWRSPRAPHPGGLQPGEETEPHGQRPWGSALPASHLGLPQAGARGRGVPRRVRRSRAHWRRARPAVYVNGPLRARGLGPVERLTSRYRTATILRSTADGRT
jgi:hypothetical protein